MTKTAILKEDLLQVFFLVKLSIQEINIYSRFLYAIFIFFIIKREISPT
jgi:hypothetical protein